MRLRKDQAGRPGAILSAELLILIPLFLVLLFGMIEYALIFSIEQQLAVSSREGARVAAQGGAPAEIQAAAMINLGPGTVAQYAQIQTTLIDSTQYPDLLPSGQAIEVRVVIPSAATVVPDILTFVGFSISNMTLAGHTIMRVE